MRPLLLLLIFPVVSVTNSGCHVLRHQETSLSSAADYCIPHCDLVPKDYQPEAYAAVTSDGKVVFIAFTDAGSAIQPGIYVKDSQKPKEAPQLLVPGKGFENLKSTPTGYIVYDHGTYNQEANTLWVLDLLRQGEPVMIGHGVDEYYRERDGKVVFTTEQNKKMWLVDTKKNVHEKQLLFDASVSNSNERVYPNEILPSGKLYYRPYAAGESAKRRNLMIMDLNAPDRPAAEWKGTADIDTFAAKVLQDGRVGFTTFDPSIPRETCADLLIFDPSRPEAPSQAFWGTRCKKKVNIMQLQNGSLLFGVGAPRYANADTLFMIGLDDSTQTPIQVAPTLKDLPFNHLRELPNGKIVFLGNSSRVYELDPNQPELAPRLIYTAQGTVYDLVPVDAGQLLISIDRGSRANALVLVKF